MKRLLCLALGLLILFSNAYAESVTQHLYELVVDGESRIGKYTGDMENGVPEGYGIFETTNPNGYSWHYVGYWHAGLMHGEGAIYWEDGSLEIGEYDNGNFVFGYYNYDGADLALYSATLFDRSLTESSSEQPEPTNPVVQYIGNKNSHVFHTTTCDSVRDMKDKNKVEFYSRQEAIDLEYKPCQRCDP